MFEKGIIYMTNCPICDSKDTGYLTVKNSRFLICNECGYDESEKILEVYPEEKTSQKGKSGNSPYKKGGHQRTMKKTK